MSDLVELPVDALRDEAILRAQRLLRSAAKVAGPTMSGAFLGYVESVADPEIRHLEVPRVSKMLEAIRLGFYRNGSPSTPDYFFFYATLSFYALGDALGWSIGSLAEKEYTIREAYKVALDSAGKAESALAAKA